MLDTSDMLDTLDMFWLETSSTRLAGALLDVLFDLAVFFLGARLLQDCGRDVWPARNATSRGRGVALKASWVSLVSLAEKPLLCRFYKRTVSTRKAYCYD